VTQLHATKIKFSESFSTTTKDYRIINRVKNFVFKFNTFYISQFIHSNFNVNLTKGKYVNKLHKYIEYKNTWMLSASLY